MKPSTLLLLGAVAAVPATPVAALASPAEAVRVRNQRLRRRKVDYNDLYNDGCLIL